MLELSHVSKTFHPGTANEVRALRDVSLEITEGSFVIVLGGNGSGKSTLLNAISGSFQPDAGQITLEGTDITKWPEHSRARFIGRVFQSPFMGTAASMSIAENLALAARRGKARGLGLTLPGELEQEIEHRVASLRMGLEKRLPYEMGSLSGGQRQAVTLLMATWHTPRLLLLDEPTAALDPRSAEHVVRLTRDIVEEGKLTTLMVTHSMQQAVRLGTRLLVMNQGRIHFDFSGAEKQRLHAEDLLSLFEEMRRNELLDEGAADFVKSMYV